MSIYSLSNVSPKTKKIFYRIACYQAIYSELFESDTITGVYPRKRSLSESYMSCEQSVHHPEELDSLPIEEAQQIDSSDEDSIDEAEEISLFEKGDTIFYRIGGRISSNEVLQTISAFDTNFVNYEDLARFSRKFEFSCSAIARNVQHSSDEILIAGGRSNSLDQIGSPEVNLFLAHNRSTTRLGPLYEPRMMGGAIKYNDAYYICGGLSGVALRTTEVYNVSWQSHYMAPEMLYARIGFQLVEFRNALFAFGGSTTSPLPVEFLDSRTRSWLSVSNSTSPYKMGHSTAKIIGNEVYVSGASRLHCFDLVANRWRRCRSPRLRTYAHSSLIYENKFYKIGGFNRLDFPARYAVYDHSLNQWEPVKNMNHGFCSSSTFVGTY